MEKTVLYFNNKNYQKILEDSFKIKNKYSETNRFIFSLNYFILYYIDKELEKNKNIVINELQNECQKLLLNFKKNILPVLNNIYTKEHKNFVTKKHSSYDLNNLEFYKKIKTVYINSFIKINKTIDEDYLLDETYKDCIIYLGNITNTFTNIFKYRYTYNFFYKTNLKDKNQFIKKIYDYIEVFFENLHNCDKFMSYSTTTRYITVNMENIATSLDVIKKINFLPEYSIFNDELFKNYQLDFDYILDDIKYSDDICIPLSRLLQHIDEISGFLDFNIAGLSDYIFILKYKNENKKILCGISNDNKNLFVINNEEKTLLKKDILDRNYINNIQEILLDLDMKKKNNPNLYICNSNFCFYLVQDYSINKYLDISFIISNNCDAYQMVQIKKKQKEMNKFFADKIKHITI